MPKILLVEDDPFIAEIYEKKFEGSGFEVVNAMTGKAALKEAKAPGWDLVLLDLVIPELSGMDVLKVLRTGGDYDPNLKVIIFSNLSGAEDRDEAVRLGANGFISKSDFSPSEVVAEVNRYLRQFSEQERNAGNAALSDGEAGAGRLGRRILFVEDEAVFVEMFGKRLRDEGYAVDAERSGVEALQRAQEGGYDMVISDMMLPAMDGKELVARLKADERTAHIPVFIMTASLDEEGMRELEESHAVERTFLKTQITPSELVYEVNKFFAA